jgi:hypothetical protein
MGYSSGRDNRQTGEVQENSPEQASVGYVIVSD